MIPTCNCIEQKYAKYAPLEASHSDTCLVGYARGTCRGVRTIIGAYLENNFCCKCGKPMLKEE